MTSNPTPVLFRWLDNLVPVESGSVEKADEVTAQAVSVVLDALDDAQCLQRDVEQDVEYHDVIAAAFQVCGYLSAFVCVFV